MEKLINLVMPYGRWGYLRLAIYPLTTLITTPFRLFQTLWACRVLANGEISKFNNFTPCAGLTNLWYWTMALNFYRHGRSGKYSNIGIDDLPISKHFSYSLPSLYAYWGSSNLTVLIGMFGWWASHIIWVTSDNYYQVFLVMVLLLISTTFYSNTFSNQHYNALGWMFCPMGVYGLYTDQWGLSGLAWLLSSFGSFTVVFLGGVLSLFTGLFEWSFAPAIAFLPAAIKMLTHFWPNFSQDNFKKTLLDIAKLLGLYHSKVKYKWGNKLWLSLGKSYYAIIYIQFCIAASIGGFETDLLWVGLVIFYLNSSRFRFADDQSLQMLILSLATAVIIQSNALWLLPFYWILASPVPFLAEFPFQRVLDIVPPLKPFQIKPFFEKMEQFLKPVKSQQNIIMAFENPKGDIGNIFLGSKPHLELLRYVATQRKITVIPSWEAIINLNYEGAPEFWGREVNEVLANVVHWKIDYVLIYQVENTFLESKWIDAGFQPVTELDWKSFKVLKNEADFLQPKWWLMKKSS
jgi:hypothetical protein